MKAFCLPVLIALIIPVCNIAFAQDSKRRNKDEVAGAAKFDLIKVLNNHTVRTQLDLTDKQEFELEKLRERWDEAKRNRGEDGSHSQRD
jgi:hypothetical protein